MRPESFKILAMLCDTFQEHGVSAVANNPDDGDAKSAKLYLKLPEGQGKYELNVLDIASRQMELLMRWSNWQDRILGKLEGQHAHSLSLSPRLKSLGIDFDDNNGLITVRMKGITGYLVMIVTNVIKN